MTKFYFDVWASDDLNGTALGELTQAYQRTWQRLDQAIGSGQFTINRHEAQFTDGWCAQDNLVRVRLVAGGPFAYDDARYKHAFFIEEGDDEAVSSDEEGGEEITRGGRDAVMILQRAVVNYEHDYTGSGNDSVYWTKALIDGNVHFKNRNAGNVLRVMLRNAAARTPNPLDPSDHDFLFATDSSGATWSDDDADWNIPIGNDLLTVLGTLAAGDTYWRMGTDLMLHAWDEEPGTDRHASVAFTAGDNIREAAQRQVHARDTISRALVQGTRKDNTLKYRWVTSAGTETALGGRREGFVEYQATPTNARLDKAGLRSIRSRKKQHDGPTTLGVEERAGDPIAFTDYIPGDSVTIDIPGIWDSVTAKVYGIQMDEDDAGDALVTVILEEQPFDPAGGDNTATDDEKGGLGDGSGGGPGGGSKCGDCPEPPPYVPVPPIDEYPACGDVEWPYTGTISGTSDTGSPGSADAWDVPGWPCFIHGETYHFAITCHSADPGAYAWGAGLSKTGNPIGAGVANLGTLGDGPDLSVTGTFVAVGSSDVDPTMAGFWVSVADSLHLHRAITATFSVWPDGYPVTVPGDVGPSGGQTTSEQMTGDGSTTEFQTNYPYEPGSLHVTVDGVHVVPTETDPTTGTFTLVTAPASGAAVIATYQIASTTATGATNPVPTPASPTSGGAPADATYLVTTAAGTLTNEVVVGTTPGGELGGTWASPTVDSSHAGSTHAAAQAAAEATAAAALAAHEADTTSVHGIADTSTLYRAGGTDVAVADGGTGASTASGARTNLGLGSAATASSSDFDAAGAAAAAQAASQPLDSDLTAFAALAIAADKLPYGTGSHTLGLADFTAAGRALVDDADASAQRTTLGLGTMAVEAKTITTQDDLLVGGSAGALARLAKGSDGQVLTVDPTTHHLVWAAPSSGFTNPMTTKGDVIVGDTGGTAIRKAVGTNGDVLTADSTATGGVKWAAPSGGGSVTDYLSGLSGTGHIIIPRLSGDPDIRVAGTNDDEFDTTDTSDPMTGWTTIGTPATHDMNSTAKSHYYVRNTTAAGNSAVGIYKVCPSFPFTVTARISGFVALSSQGRIYLVVGEASIGKFLGIGFAGDSSTMSAVVADKWTNPTTFGSTITSAFDIGASPMYLRLVVVSSTDVTGYVSMNGYSWRLFMISTNPGFTVGSIGFAINRASAGQNNEAIFDWIRCT